MHEWLAEAYGTGADISDAPQQDDVEKLAQAEILDQMFEAEEVDWSALDAETVEKIAGEIFGDENQITADELMKAAADDGEPEGEVDEAQEKFAEADFAGRVMAHAFNQELDNIETEKEAGAREMALKGLAKARKGARWVGEKITPSGATQKAYESGSKAMKKKQIKKLMKKHPGITPAQAAFRAAESPSSSGEGIKYMAQRMRAGGASAGKLHRRVGAGAVGGGTAAAAGGTAAALKKESALDTLAEKRAMEILEENGYTFDDGQDKLAEAVEQRAFEMLVNAGYIEEE
jgi:hypothetical protein